MSVSSDVLSGDGDSTVVSSHATGPTRRAGQFPYAYLKSRLSTLPEEQTHRQQWQTESQVSQFSLSVQAERQYPQPKQYKYM